MRELAAVLQDELALVRELLAVCRQEQDCLMTEDIKGIEAITAVKGELARKLHALEEERQQTAGDFPGGTDRRFLMVSGAGAETGGGRHDIESLRQSLRMVVRQLQEINETNRLLARQSLAYAQKMVALLLPEGETPATVDRIV